MQVHASVCIEIGYKGEIDLKNDFGIVRKIKFSRFRISHSFSNIFEGYSAMSKVNRGNQPKNVCP